MTPTGPARRPGFKPAPPPPAPREVNRPFSAGVGLWAMRLFLLPHTLVGLGLLVAMVFMPVWQVCGTTSAALVTRAYTSTTAKNRTTYYVEYVDPAAAGKTKRESISRSEYDRLLHALSAANPITIPAGPDANAAPPQAPPTVTVKTMPVGQWHYTGVIAPGSSGWTTVGFVWLFGLFWNVIVGLFAFGVYVAPWRDKRLRRDGEASPGRIVRKRTGRGSRGSAQYVLEYAFTPTARVGIRPRAGDLEVTGEQLVSRQEWDAAAEGDEVWVLHWPGKAKPNVLWGMG